jgi:flagellin
MKFKAGGALTVAATGLGAENTSTDKAYVGTYSLYTVDGSPVVVSHDVGKTQAEVNYSGLGIGSFSADTAVVVSNRRATAADAAAVSTGGGSGVLKGDTLSINGISIGASRAIDDTSSYVDSTKGSVKSASAIAIAAAINRSSDETGVTAKATENVLRGTGFTTSNTAVAGLKVNGISITVVPVTRNAVVDAMNEVSGQTGVVARAYGDGIELVAADGRNILVESTANSEAASLGLTGIDMGKTHYAAVELSSDRAFTVERGSGGDSNFEKLGFRIGTFGGADTGMKVAEVDVTTQLGAGMAITAIDHAINDVASAQARSGAFQNRLDASISVLSESSENASAARSRILDTDYATETTALAKAQIVQQAATAMLAQANQQQQSVLALLQ